MKTIQEQKVFQFSSLVVAVITLTTTILLLLSDYIDPIQFAVLGISSVIFLAFIFWFNNKIRKLNGFVSSYLTTYLSYTFFIVLVTLISLIISKDLILVENLMIAGVFLIYGYMLNLAISLIVYLLYKAILYFRVKT